MTRAHLQIVAAAALMLVVVAAALIVAGWAMGRASIRVEVPTSCATWSTR